MAAELLFIAGIVVVVLAFVSLFPGAARQAYYGAWLFKSVALAILALLIAVFAISSGSLAALLVGGFGVAFLVLSFTVGGGRDLVDDHMEW